MKKYFLLLLVANAFILLNSDSLAQSLYFPPLTGTTWETVTPQSVGWSPDSINQLLNFLDANHTKAFIVLKDGYIVFEHYSGTFSADSNWYWASAGKSLTAFLVGIAQQDGILSINDSTSHYIGVGWTSCLSDKERLITVLHQLTMTTGLKDLVLDPECTLPEFLKYEADAGTRWAYHTAPYTLLDKVVENASGQNYNVYFNTKIRSRIGMNGAWIPSGYNNVYFSNARSMARFGLLVLNRGIWDSDTLLADTSYFQRMTNPSQSLNPSYGYLWWLNGKSSYMIPVLQTVFPGSWAPDAPSDMIAAIGKNGQFINIVPSQRLIMVRMGESPDSSYDVPMDFNNDIWKKLNAMNYNQTSVEKDFTPTRFILEQNYPNPFNSSTVIDYQLRVNGLVNLKVYDILGRVVGILVNEHQTAGSHSAVFNANNLPSGMYFYRLQSGIYADTKKLVIIK